MEVDKSKFHREVIAPFTGQAFIIRRARLKEFLTHIGGLPLPMDGTISEALNKLREKAEATGDPNTDEQITRFYVSKGVVEPKVWFGPAEECPADQIYYEDLGSDLDYVAGQVVAFSNEVTSLKSMENFFRGSGSRVAGPDGQEVRAEAEQPVAE